MHHFSLPSWLRVNRDELSRSSRRVWLDARLELVALKRITERQLAELEGDEADPWDAGSSVLLWRPKEWHAVVRDDRGRLVAAAGLVVVEVEVSGERLPVVGLGGVIVNRHHRGRGHAAAVLTAAIAHAEGLGPEFMLLFCHPDRMGLYLKFGFSEVKASVTVEQANGPVHVTMRTMWRALRPGALWPGGSVAVRSLPF
jgi:predicted N-acetyltransferase YhbS